MPCYDPRSNPTSHINSLESDVEDLQDEVNKLTSYLCFIFSLVEDIDKNDEWPGITLMDYICNRNYNLRSWYEAHQQKDYNRLMDEIKKYSDNELDILRKILLKKG